jgi:hypothetical protein
MTTEEFKIAKRKLELDIANYVHKEIQKLEEQSGIKLKRLTIYNQEPKYRKVLDASPVREEDFIMSIIEFDV